MFARTKVLSILTLGRNGFFRGDFDSVQFPGRFTKIWGRKAKKPKAKDFWARVPEGCNVFSHKNSKNEQKQSYLALQKISYLHSTKKKLDKIKAILILIKFPLIPCVI